MHCPQNPITIWVYKSEENNLPHSIHPIKRRHPHHAYIQYEENYPFHAIYIARRKQYSSCLICREPEFWKLNQRWILPNHQVDWSPTMFLELRSSHCLLLGLLMPFFQLNNLYYSMFKESLLKQDKYYINVSSKLKLISDMNTHVYIKYVINEI